MERNPERKHEQSEQKERETYPEELKADMQGKTQSDRERDHGNQGASPENEEERKTRWIENGDGTPRSA